jgi:hypothetical protein
MYNGIVRNESVVRVAMSGKMRSGKDSFSDRLVSKYGFRKYAFADRLKEVAREMYGMPPGIKDRHLLVELGRKMCEVDQLVWVNYVLGKMPLRQDVVVSDMRFQYEYHALKAFGFVMVRVNVDEATRVARVTRHGSKVDLALMTDKSETDLDNCAFDYTVNGDTYDSLYAGVNRVMTTLGRKSNG